MHKNDAIISRYQMLSLGFLALLSPIIRLLPQQAVAIACSHAWLSALMTLVPLTLLFLLVFRFFKYALPNEGFGELFIRVLGKPVGKFAILLFTLWLIFYVAFALRSAADRYITSAYYNTAPAVFIIIMLALSLIPLLGRFKNLGRTAESLLPLLGLVLLLIFIFSFGDVDKHFLPPAAAAHFPSLLQGMPVVANVLSLALYIGFLEGRIAQKNLGQKRLSYGCCSCWQWWCCCASSSWAPSDPSLQPALTIPSSSWSETSRFSAFSSGWIRWFWDCG